MPDTIKYCLFFIVLFVPTFLYGQTKSHALDGFVQIKGGPTCRYQINFTISGSAINGESTTTDPGGHELKASIKGKIDKNGHTLSFVESDMIANPGDSACLFNVKLTFRTIDSQKVLIGDFKGRNIYNKPCDEGTVFFVLKCKPGYLFEKPKQLPAQLAPVPTENRESDSLALGQLPEFFKIKSDEEVQLDWTSDTCVFEIWDGEVVDGDIVTIIAKKEKILEHYILTANRKTLRINVRDKITTLTLLAENEGKAPPNTSMVLLADGKKYHGFLVCLEKGKTADIVLNKK